MPFCNQCGSEHAEGARFCPKCGKPLAGNGSADSATDSLGFECFEEGASGAGSAVEDAAQSSLATPVDADSPVNPAVRARRKGSSGKLIAAEVTGGAAIAALVVIGAIFLFGTGRQDALVIDEAVFPNEVIRQALFEQVDADGDGVLAAEEAASVTGLVLTRDAATFFLDGAEVSVPEGGAVADDAKDNDVGDGEVEIEDGADADTGDAPASSLAGLEALPNLRTLVARDAGIAELPAASLSSLEYIDCRNNPIATIDLSGNANLSTMFCDPAVELTGLEKAGLYFTELLTEASVDDANEAAGGIAAISIEYDTRGRPVRAKGAMPASDAVVPFEELYTYDNQSRLTSSALSMTASEITGLSVEDQMELEEQLGDLNEDGFVMHSSSYAYAESGLPSEIVDVQRGLVDDDQENRITTTYSFDDAGYVLTQAGFYEMESGETEAGAFDYYRASDGYERVTKQDEDEIATTHFSLDGNGELVSTRFSSYVASTSGDATYGYSVLGSLSSAEVIPYNVDDLAEATRQAWEISFDESGKPVGVAYEEEGASALWRVQCDDAGYPVEIDFVDPNGELASPRLRSSYVKMIGKLQDRQMRRFLPSFGWSLSEVVWAGSAETFGSSRLIQLPSYNMELKKYGPREAVLSAMGLLPRSLVCPNEMQLLQYDREHWTDGLELSGLPDPTMLEIGEGGGGLSFDATEADDQIYDIQTRLFSLNLPDSWRDKVDIEVTDADGDYPSAGVFLKGNPDIYLLGMNVVDASEEMLDGDVGAGVADRIPLPNDKRLDIGTCYYGTILLECDESGSEPYFGSLTDGQYADLFEMIYGSPMTLEELLSDNSIEKRSMIHELQRQHIQDAISSSIVVNGFA